MDKTTLTTFGSNELKRQEEKLRSDHPAGWVDGFKGYCLAPVEGTDSLAVCKVNPHLPGKPPPLDWQGDGKPPEDEDDGRVQSIIHIFKTAPSVADVLGVIRWYEEELQ